MDKNHDEIRYRFTKYVETAVKRTRGHYIEREMKRTDWEILVEDTYQIVNPENIQVEQIFNTLSQEHIRLADAMKIRSVWDQYTDGALRTEVLKLKDRELIVLFAKVYEGLTFSDIGEIIHMDANTVSNIYNYVRKKLKKGCGKTNGI